MTPPRTAPANTRAASPKRSDYRGVLCVELFILEDGSIRERIGAAPAQLRPRDDRRVRDEPVRSAGARDGGAPARLDRAAQRLRDAEPSGDLWFDEKGEAATPDWAKLLSIPGVKLHLYGKAEARPARKMGHVTVVAPTGELAMARAREAARVLGLPEPI